jgi:hypothetical protein
MVATVTLSEFVAVWACGVIFGSIATAVLIHKIHKFFKEKQ